MPKNRDINNWIVIAVYFVVMFWLANILVGCQSKPETMIKPVDPVDTLIAMSEKRLDTAKVIGFKSDSVVKVVVKEKIREIKQLQVSLMAAQTLKMAPAEKIVEKIIYRVDTVYIETQKNFWGKKKTKVTVVSDSSIVEPVDSLDNQ